MRWEEKLLKYDALLKEWRREKLFAIKVKGVTEYELRKPGMMAKKFLALQVDLMGLPTIRKNLDLSATHSSQTTHITIGEKYI